MTKYKIIGNMTGNSMDAIDLVLTEFDGDIMKDVCTFTKPYSKNMQEKMEYLRKSAFNKTEEEILAIDEFKKIHDEYIEEIADCINEMCEKYNIDKNTIDAIGFHGKTLDHNPPSKAKVDNTLPYTLQIGSGQMLADLTGISVVYDFRSDFIMANFEGAPLVPPHNAHISASEGDGVYYNGGNTSNFAVVVDGKAVIGTDAGPFNEYIDNFIRQKTKEVFDRDGMFGKKGRLNVDLLQKMFDIGRDFYEMSLPKSGDPQYYHKNEIFDYVSKNKIKFEDVVYTFEYFSAYIAVYTMCLVDKNIKLPTNMVLFGGGWKNPVVREVFDNLLNWNAFVLPEHRDMFDNFIKRFNAEINIKNSVFGEYMEARLFADLARYKLENKVWEIPEVISSDKNIVCGVIAYPGARKSKYSDCVNRATKGWQKN